MPAKTANQLNKFINTFFWDGKPALVRRNLLQLVVSEGGDSVFPHASTSSKALALKMARSLFQAGDYFRRGLLLYWSGASNGWLDGGRHPAESLAESPSPFYKAASVTMRMLGKEATSCDVDADPPARIVEALTLKQLSSEDKQRAKNVKCAMATLDRGFPREAHDFLWKKAWKVLPTRQTEPS
ncbi:hypothetical protein MTO96_029554 [Rhipicephalus appendiculatus]